MKYLLPVLMKYLTGENYTTVHDPLSARMVTRAVNFGATAADFVALSLAANGQYESAVQLAAGAEAARNLYNFIVEDEPSLEDRVEKGE